jgi:ribonuclease HI
LHNRDTVGRIVKWSVELGEFSLEFYPRQDIKSQILADFISKWTKTQQPPPTEKPEHWKMYFDGSLNLEGAGAGILFISPQADHLKYILQIHYKASNNDTEYEALIRGLRVVVSLGIKRLIAYGDSKVIIDQVNKACNIRKDLMNAYCAEVSKLKAHFEGLDFHHICRDNNVAANVLSKLGSKRALVLADMFVQDLRKPSIRLLSNPETLQSDVPLPGSRDVLMAEAEDDWHLDFITYILEKRVPEDKVEHEKIVRCSANYVIIGTELYRRSASNGVLMKCILRSEGLQLVQEIHGGECGNHAASANLVGKAFMSGFYWPTALADT